MSSHLQSHGLTFSLVEAIDGREKLEGKSESHIATNEEACWESHVLAMQFFYESGGDYAIVMEDDCVLDSQINWASFVERLPEEMASRGLSYLQLGHITAAYSWKRNLIEAAMRLRSSCRDSSFSKIVLGDRVHILVPGESRWGTHCYVIDRYFAEKAPALNHPAWAHVDDFFQMLAQAQWGKKGPLKMGRLKKSIAEQVSRQASGTALDTDIGSGAGFGRR